jgi:hypothetical protein
MGGAAAGGRAAEGAFGVVPVRSTISSAGNAEEDDAAFGVVPVLSIT